MFTENDFMTPKERVNEALRQRMYEAQNGSPLAHGRENDSTPPCRDRLSQSDNSSSRERREGCCAREERLDSHSGRKTWGLEDYPLASVYAPLQSWRNLYDAEAGLSRGTIFKELDLPFLCGERKGGNCRGR